MKRVLLALLLSAPLAWAWSQDAVPQAQGEDRAERQRIDEERQQANAALDAQERACHTKFAVTSCLHAIGLQRSQTLTELRRREGRLNDIQRQQRGAEQRQRVEEKRAERLRTPALQPSLNDPAQQDGQDAQDRRTPQERQAAAPSNTGVERASGEAKAARVVGAEEAERNRAAHAQKLEAARTHRLERDKRLKDRPAEGKSLPLPP